jgi:hypothetical protein
MSRHDCSLRPKIGDVGLTDPLDSNVRGLAARCRVWPADDFLLSGLVGESVAYLKLHRQHTGRAG